MKTFLTMWWGQFVSQIGTALTRFALLVWVYEQTGSATDVALLGFFAFLPAFFVGPFAGVWVDRLDRRKVMLLADIGAGLMTLLLLELYATDQLQTWHLYAAQMLASIFGSFQSPAYSAATTLLVDKAQYARINALRALAQNSAQVIAPFLASLLLVWVGLGGVMMIDLVTFVVAVITLLIVRVPRPDAAGVTVAATSFWAELRAGFAYTWARPGLVGLMVLYTAMNFIAALTYYVTLPTLILARTEG